jgi:hypothetical protein
MTHPRQLLKFLLPPGTARATRIHVDMLSTPITSSLARTSADAQSHDNPAVSSPAFPYLSLPFAVLLFCPLPTTPLLLPVYPVHLFLRLFHHLTLALARSSALSHPTLEVTLSGARL